MLSAKERLLKLMKDKATAKIETITVPDMQAPDKKVAVIHRELSSNIIDKFNDQQQRAIDLAIAGKSFVLTGPAGSGKTATVVDGILAALMKSGKIHPLASMGHKYLHTGSPSVCGTSFTNKAVENLKSRVSADLKPNFITMHKILEFQPEYFEYYDEDSGMYKTKMSFEPNRNELNPIPNIQVLFIDEAPMIDIPLMNKLAAAIANDIQIILIGDIHQLPPVFGQSIFIWAMQLGMETVELTEVYRQALKSPIISLATRVRSGKQITLKELPDFAKTTEQGSVFIRPWKKKLGETAAIRTINEIIFPELLNKGEYNPKTDIILTPFNKSFGTISMNEAMAGLLQQREPDPIKKEVHEIYSGITKKYLRIGERVLYNKSDATVVDIKPNPHYYGKKPRPSSDTLLYTGVESDKEKIIDATTNLESEADDILAHLDSHLKEDSSISTNASHIITVVSESNLDQEVELSQAGEVNNLLLGYAITVHKAQGSGYNKVFFITHSSQNNMLYRELLYTAITRAINELYIICEANMFVKGIVSQRIPGNTLEAKLANFKSKQEMNQAGTAERPSAKLVEVLHMKSR